MKHFKNFRRVLLATAVMLALHGNAQNFRDRLLPTDENFGFHQNDYWTWCGSVIKGEDGKYHMFASRWPKSLAFNIYWLTNSEIVHAVSDKPEGPYVFSDVALSPRGEQFWDGKMTHNPAIRKCGDTYLLFYTGTTYKGDMPDSAHPITAESPLKIEAHQHERIGLATAKSPYGPWTRSDMPILDVVPNSWEQYLVANPSPFVFDDGRVMLYYKGVEQLKKHAIGVAMADHWEGPYRRVSDKPLDMGIGAEDPTIWREDGKFHALMLDHDRKYSDKEIYYAQSKDGLKWEMESNPLAITKNVKLKDGSISVHGAMERPAVLIENGKATHVFLATKNKANTHSWNMCIPLRPSKQSNDVANWFKEAGFGMFIHWGLYSLPAGVWNNQPINDERYINPLAEHIMLLKKIPLKEYAALANDFNPVDFDAEKLVANAKAAGVKYICFTTKHHDGFAMYDSKVSSYNIVDATPYKKDPLKVLAEACKKEGVKLCLYYSLGRDWENPNAIAREIRRNFWDFPDTTGYSYQKYLDEKVMPQLKELLTNYGDIAMIWFDTPELTTIKQSISLEMFVKQWQPNCIINTRVGNNVGDVIEMEDNRIPEKENTKPWECPATMAESWGYSVLDTKEYWKSSDELIEKLVEIRSKGGNYLLNVGPDAKGVLPELATVRLQAITQWMAVNAEAIYKVKPVANKIYNCYLTQNQNHIFIFIKNSAEKNLLMYIDSKSVKKINLLTSKGEQPVAFKPSQGKGIVIDVPLHLPFSSLSVLKLEKIDTEEKKPKISD
jgi:alpha-L-fucosidase